MTKIQISLAAFVVALLSFAMARADHPSADAKPVVEIVEQLEKEGYGPFIEFSFDDGFWEVEAYQQEACYELAVDVHSGKILSKYRDDPEPRPPRNAQPLSKILRGLNKAGYNGIDDISFERRYWEMELLRPDGEHEILVNPRTGEVIRDRIDD